MENSLFQLSSISDYWMSLSSIVMAKDMIFGVMCGAGLFLLLIPFLKKYSASPPPGSRKNPPKSSRETAERNSPETAAPHLQGLESGRDGRKNVEETQNTSRPVEIPIKDPLLDSMSFPPWTTDKKLDQLPLSQLLSYFKFVENLIQRKFSQIFWGMSSMLSESAVASAWVSKRPKTVRFSDACGPFPALPMAQGPPQISQTQPLPHQLVTPSLAGLTETQTLGNHLSSTANQILSSSTSSITVKPCSTCETKIWASLPIENQPWQQGLEWNDTIDSNVQNQQAGISWPTHNLPNGTLTTEPVRSASILPENCQFLQHHKGTQSEDKVTEVREIRGSPFTVLSSPELTQLWGHFPANSPCQPKNKPGLPKPAQPSILDSKSCKLSQMMGSVPSVMPLKKSEACDMPDPIKKGPGLSANDFPCTSSSSPGEGLEPRKPALRTDQQSYVNTVQDLSFLDPKTQMKLESNITQLPMKQRRRPTSVSKAEYYSKAAMVLEKLHHRDPGGTRVETVSTARLQSPLLAHSPSQVQVIQRAPPPAASHGPSKAHLDIGKSYLSTKTRAFCFQTRTQQSRTVQEIGRSSVQPRTSPRIYKPAAWMKFENMASGHPCWSGTMLDPQERIPPSVVKQINRSKEKEGTPPVWKESLESMEFPSSQVINIYLRDFESTEANRSPGHFQTPTPRHSGDSALNAQVYSETDFRSSKQPQSWSVDHCSDSSSSVSLPSEHLFPIFKYRTKKPKTSQSLGHVFVRRDHSQETQDFRFPKDKIQATNHKVFHPNEERGEFLRSRAKSQGERLGEGQSSQAEGLNPSTQIKDTAKTECQPSLDMPGKGQALPESYLKNIIRIILQYLDLSTKDKGQKDSLKKESSPPSSTMTQEESDIKEKLIYSLATEVQSLMNIVVQLLVNWLGLKVGHPSEAQWCKAEPLIPQLRDSFFHFPEGIYKPKNSRPEKMSSGPHTSPMAQSHTFRNKVIGDKHESGIATRETCVPHQNSVKRGMGCEQPRSPSGNMYRGIGDGPPSGIATETACDPGQNRMDCGSHTISQEHSHPFTYRETGE
ncbi:spermatogenesis-associated protein 31E1-like [Microtus oregoni]|uniref:spermatogenesis-associated protein 31E1-like n=1 Tax=Microtus oregoni TaxID=111838 RepID=UPI001BB1F54C|nr:spermatogenesis-associated protein 31E1-like [Microtus oregoni]